ncbi:hypothetical protein [Blattabacterium cuenoti]
MDDYSKFFVEAIQRVRNHRTERKKTYFYAKSAILKHLEWGSNLNGI